MIYLNPANINHVRWFIFWLILLFGMSCAVYSQESFSSVSSFHASKQEKAYLHADKPFYVIGDTIWMKGYLVDAQTHKENDAESRFLYVELIDRKEKVVLRKKIKKEEGGGFSNFFAIDGEIPEGDYALRAYTRFMRNEGEEHFFTKPIKIYDNIATSLYTNLRFETDKKDRMYAVVTLLTKNGEPHQKKRVEYMVRTKPVKNRFHRVKTNEMGEVKIKIPPKKELSQYIDLTMVDGDWKINRKLHLPDIYDYDVGFYPEGGYLIAGMNQTIAFKAESTTGISPKITGYILSQNADTLARLHSEHEGVGSFSLTATAGDTLQAVVTDEHGWRKVFRLPTAVTDKVALTVEQNDSTLRYQLLVPQRQDLQDDLSLLVHVRGQVVHTARLSKGCLSGEIDKKKLPEGVIQLTVFNDADEALTERLTFVWKQEPVFQVAFSGTSAVSRSLIKMGMRLVDEEGNPMKGNFSMSVTDDFAVDIDKEDDNIRSYLLMRSDLRGHIRNSGYYFGIPSEDKKRQLDQLMLTQGWRKFPGEPFFRKNGSQEADLMKKVWKVETEQVIIGQVKGWFNRTVRKEKDIIITAPKHNGVHIVSTDGNGYFEFSHNYPDYTGFSISLLNKKGRMHGIKLMEETFPTVVVDWEAVTQKKVRTTYLTEVHTGLTVRDGEKVYQLPEVLVQASSPYSDYAYYSIGEERVEQKKGRNALELLNQIPEVCIVGMTKAHELKGERAVYAEPDETVGWRIGLRLRGTKVNYGTGRLMSGFPCVVATVFVDGQRVSEEVSLKNLKTEDIKYIDILERPIVKREVAGSNAWLFYDNNPWSRKSNKGGRMGSGQSIWITTVRNKRWRFVESDWNNAKTVPLSYAENAQFYAPKYLTEESRKIVNSDKRSTIHWEPNIRLNEKGEAGLSFYTADRPSTYTVVIEGITDEGQVCRYVRQIK